MLQGGAGQDLITFDRADTVSGGAGADTLVGFVAGGRTAVIADFDRGEDSLQLNVEPWSNAAPNGDIDYDAFAFVEQDGNTLIQIKGQTAAQISGQTDLVIGFLIDWTANNGTVRPPITPTSTATGSTRQRWTWSSTVMRTISSDVGRTLRQSHGGETGRPFPDEAVPAGSECGLTLTGGDGATDGTTIPNGFTLEPTPECDPTPLGAPAPAGADSFLLQGRDRRAAAPARRRTSPTACPGYGAPTRPLTFSGPRTYLGGP